MYFSIIKSDSIADVTGIIVAMLKTHSFYFLYLISFYASSKFVLKNIISSSGSLSYSSIISLYSNLYRSYIVSKKKYLVCILKTLSYNFPCIFTMLC